MLRTRTMNFLLTSLLTLAGTVIAAAPSTAQVVVADAGEDLTIECSASGGSLVTLDGLGSTVDGGMAAIDPDASFLWEAPGIDFDDETSPTPNATFPVGTTTVTLTVTHTDPTTLVETSDQDTVDITVTDNTPPAVAVLADPPILWPPNHKLHEIAAIVMVTDICDPDPDVVLTSLDSSEPDNGTGDGDTVDDIQGADIGSDDRSFLLRAERAGNGDGRVYTAVYNVTDASGNNTNGLTEVLVPHDQGDVKAAKAAAKAAKKAAKASAKAAKRASKAAEKAAKAAAKAAKTAAKAAKKAAKAAGNAH
jgi:hypothetical protein